MCEDVSYECRSIEEHAQCVSKEVNEWVRKNDVAFDAVNGKGRAEIQKLEEQVKKLETQIKKLETEITDVERKRKTIRERGGEIQQGISKDSIEKRTALNIWSAGINSYVTPARQLLAKMQKSLSEGESAPLRALRTKEELSKIVTKQMPLKPPMFPLIVTERSGPEVSALLGELRDVLVQDKPEYSSLTSALEKLQASGGTIFGEQGLTKHIEQFLPSPAVKNDELIRRRPRVSSASRPTLAWDPAKCNPGLVLSDQNRAVCTKDGTMKWMSVLGTEQVNSFKIQVGQKLPGSNSPSGCKATIGFIAGFCLESKFLDQIKFNHPATGTETWLMDSNGDLCRRGSFGKKYASIWSYDDVVEAIWNRTDETISFKVNDCEFGTAYENVSFCSDWLFPVVQLYNAWEIALIASS